MSRAPGDVEGADVARAHSGRLGYACLNTILRKEEKPSVFCSRTCRIDTIKKEGMDYLKEIGRQNAIVSGGGVGFPVSVHTPDTSHSHFDRTGPQKTDRMERQASHLLHARQLRTFSLRLARRIRLLARVRRRRIGRGGRSRQGAQHAVDDASGTVHSVG